MNCIVDKMNNYDIILSTEKEHAGCDFESCSLFGELIKRGNVMNYLDEERFIKSFSKESADLDCYLAELKKLLEQDSISIDFHYLYEHMKSICSKTNDWLSSLVKEEPIPDMIKSLYFGIFTESKTGFLGIKRHFLQLYLSGSMESPDSNEDWACYNTYLPEGRYANIEEFNELLHFSKKVKDRKKEKH